MSNHSKFLKHITLISWSFFEIITSGKCHRDMKELETLASNSKHFKIYGIPKKWKTSAPWLTFSM